MTGVDTSDIVTVYMLDIDVVIIALCRDPSTCHLDCRNCGQVEIWMCKENEGANSPPYVHQNMCDWQKFGLA